MDSIKKLADLFAEFPTIGQRTANRFVFYLLKLPKEKIEELTQAIQELKSKTKFCLFCFKHYEPTHSGTNIIKEANTNLCPICVNPLRNTQLLCVVEKETDLTSIENTKKYNGLYFVLNGLLNLKNNNIDTLRIKELKERVENSQKFGLQKINFKEIIIATNPTPEGRATSVLIERALKELPLQFPAIAITHLAKGLPVGGELEYADQETLESAFDGRK